MKRSLCGLLILLAGLLPHAGGAAELLTPGEARAHLMRGIREGRGLRVTADGNRSEIFEPALEGTHLTFAVDDRGGRGRIPLELIERIETRGSAWKRVAIGGGLLGAGAATALAVIIANTDDDSLEAEDAVMLVLTGTATGALAGAIIGAPAQVWNTVYRVENQALGLFVDPRGRGAGAGILASRRF